MKARLPLQGFSVIVVSALAWSTATAEVVVYRAPEGEVLSTEYEVLADGKKVDVYTARTLDPPFAGKEWDAGGPYAFANFDTSGPVTVRVAAKRSLRKVVIRPESPAVKLTPLDDHTVSLALDGPRKLSIEPDGKRGPLLLFANPPERDAPKAGQPGVLYFGPGIHKAGAIHAASGQTVYLAGGAVVKGGISAVGSNIRICGRGILDGSDYAWEKGPCTTLGIQGDNVTVEGITIRGSPQWTIVPHYSRQVTIRNVKICGSRVGNDDGIDPCNSQDVLITDCFIRTVDDCVAMKGTVFLPSAPNANVERVRVENCVLWSDVARIFLLGHESQAPYMREITLRNLDVIHFSACPFLLEPGEDMRLEDVTVENVRLHGERQGEFIRLRPTVNMYMKKKTPGSIRNVVFKNVELAGEAGDYLIELAGADAEHDIRGVTFENVSILGARLTRNWPHMTIGKYVGGVRFTPK